MSLIFYQQHGEGFPVVLLHGFCETHEIWQGFSSSLAHAASVQVFTPDLPGFGRSARLHEKFSIEDVAQSMVAWLKQAGVEKCITIGHSLGGYVTLAMAARQPDFFKGIGLFHSTAFPDSVEKRQNRDKVIDFVVKNGVQPFIDTFIPGLFHQKDNAGTKIAHAIASQTDKETLVRYLAAMRDRPARTAFLKAFSAPVLILAGEYDSVIQRKSLEEQAASLQHPFFRNLMKSGHMGMLEEPETALAAIKSFISVCTSR